MNEEQRKRMAEKSGANESAPKYSVPFIQFSGKDGSFTKVTYKDKEKVETPLTTPVEFVILKKRRTLASFRPSYFTTEHDKSTDKVMLFKSTKVNGKVSVTFEKVGFANELREQNALLKTHEIVYVLHEGEVCKLEIKSGSVMDYYAFQKAYGDEQLHGFEITTKVSAIETENDQGSYWKIVFNFTQGLPKGVDFDTVESKMDEVTVALAKVDAYTKQRIEQKGGVSTGLSPEEAARIKSIRESAQKAEKDFQNFGKGEDEINPDDIPF